MRDSQTLGRNTISDCYLLAILIHWYSMSVKELSDGSIIDRHHQTTILQLVIWPNTTESWSTKLCPFYDTFYKGMCILRWKVKLHVFVVVERCQRSTTHGTRSLFPCCEWWYFIRYRLLKQNKLIIWCILYLHLLFFINGTYNSIFYFFCILFI